MVTAWAVRSPKKFWNRIGTGLGHPGFLIDLAAGVHFAPAQRAFKGVFFVCRTLDFAAQNGIGGAC